MMGSASNCRAVQAVAPGRLELVRKPIRDPGPGEVRIREQKMIDRFIGELSFGGGAINQVGGVGPAGSLHCFLPLQRRGQ
jgi:hypothetical protein